MYFSIIIPPNVLWYKQGGSQLRHTLVKIDIMGWYIFNLMMNTRYGYNGSIFHGHPHKYKAILDLDNRKRG